MASRGAGPINEERFRAVERARALNYPQRRLAGHIVAAFNHACDHRDFETAEQLIRVLEMMINRPNLAPRRSRDKETVVAAWRRLWALRHSEAQSDEPAAGA